MKIYRREDICEIPVSVQQAWTFFANPLNLEKLTPPAMAFSNVYLLDAPEVYPGMMIVHKVSPFPGVKLTWATEITHVEHGRRFVDEQRKGPFALWHHIHEFAPVPGGTEIKDTLYYGIPFGFLGTIAHVLQVKSQIGNIFKFRKEKLAEIFGSGDVLF